MKKRVVVLESNPLLLKRIIEAIENTTEWVVANYYRSIAEALPRIARDQATLFIADVPLHDYETFRKFTILKSKIPFTNIVILHDQNNPGDLLTALRLSAGGYILHEAFLEDCDTTLESIFHGGLVISAAIAEDLHEVYMAYSHLFNEQQAIATSLLIKGKNYEAIAHTLEISIESAKRIIYDTFTLLEAESAIRI